MKNLLLLLIVLVLCGCGAPVIKFYHVPSAVFVHETDAERFIGEQTEIVIIESKKEEKEDGTN